jgi:hypothetical protein
MNVLQQHIIHALRYSFSRLLLQVVSELLAVAAMVQHAVGVAEDIPLGDRVVFVVRAELLQRPVGDVLSAVDRPLNGHVLPGFTASHQN